MRMRLVLWDIVALIGVVISVAFAEWYLYGRAHIGEVPPSVQCLAQMSNVWLLLEQAHTEQGRFPDALVDALDEMTRGELICRAKTMGLEGASWLEAYRVDFEYPGSGLTMAELQGIRRFPLVFDKNGNHADGTVSVLFAGGERRLMTEDEFQQMLGEAIRQCADNELLANRLRGFVAEP